MSEQRKITLEIVQSAVIELNETLDEKIELERGEEAALYGKDAPLDSLSLVNLIVLVEERAHEALGKAVTLADDRAMSQFRSPFRSVGSLADYLAVVAA